MRFHETIPVRASQPTVAGLLNDLPALLACLPICKETSVQPDGSFRTIAEDRVGPFKARLVLTGSASTGSEGGLSVKAQGQDAALGSGMVLQLTLGAAAAGDGAVVSVDAEVQVRGKLASLGVPIFNLKAAEVMKQFGIALRSRLEGGGGV